MACSVPSPNDRWPKAAVAQPTGVEHRRGTAAVPKPSKGSAREWGQRDIKPRRRSPFGRASELPCGQVEQQGVAVKL